MLMMLTILISVLVCAQVGLAIAVAKIAWLVHALQFAVNMDRERTCRVPIGAPSEPKPKVPDGPVLPGNPSEDDLLSLRFKPTVYQRIRFIRLVNYVFALGRERVVR